MKQPFISGDAVAQSLARLHNLHHYDNIFNVFVEGYLNSQRFLFVLGFLFLVACGGEAEPAAVQPVSVPTLVVAAVAPSVTPSPEGVPPTFTPAGFNVEQATLDAFASFTPGPTFTPFPTRTATATFTPTPFPTATETPLPSLTPSNTPPASTTPAPPPADGNYLPNSSFEGGWYHMENLPELQIPDGWLFEYDTGNNSLDPDPWNKWVRPEVRVLSSDFLPRSEWDDFIWNGRQTLKVFKGEGSISYRLLTDVYLDPGTYTLTINVYPDLVEAYTPGGGKVWASDELSGEIRFIAGENTTDWKLPEFGRRNTIRHTFEVTSPRTMRVGVGIRGRWAIANNGWFLDDWALRKIN